MKDTDLTAPVVKVFVLQIGVLSLSSAGAPSNLPVLFSSQYALALLRYDSS